MKHLKRIWAGLGVIGGIILPGLMVVIAIAGAGCICYALHFFLPTWGAIAVPGVIAVLVVCYFLGWAEGN